MAKRRVDALIVERGLAESRAKAQALIMAGQVVVVGKPALKPGMMLSEDVEISLLEPPRFVGRGGIKLEHALEQFRIDVSGKIAADIGASTGGFTDCLLKGGASRVYAVDVGTGQLDYRLRRDGRVVVMEGVNARYAMSLPEPVDLVTMDLSFISVEKVIPSVAGLLKANGDLLVLIKPQFEARRNEVGKGGIIKDPLLHATVMGRFINWAVTHPFRLRGLIASPILGSSGNREFFVWLGA
ncbi:MAG: TlyA family RNA methyltransferase [Dehalococcoidales bacterium]|nr:TlyA family RNA methyltransferase [Dehalococcoidales bacterium]